MTIAPTLQRAAGLAFDNLQVKWLANQLPTRVRQFCGNSLSLCPDSDPNKQPLLNWLTILSCFGVHLVNPMPLTELTAAAQYVYRICWLTNQLQVQGLIDATLATQMLSNYNFSFG